MIIRPAALLIVLLSLVSPTVLAVSDSLIAACAQLSGDLARLECYDTLAKEKNLDGPQLVATDTDGTGKWQVSASTNPVDDSKTVHAILIAESGTSKWGDRIYLIARCQSNETNVFIKWQDYLGSKANVLTRVGSSKAVTSEWLLSTDSQSTFHPSPIGFLKQIMASDNLVTQITPYNENPVTAIFDTAGVSNAIKDLRTTCNW